MSNIRNVWAATHTGLVRKENEDCCCVGDWLGEGDSSFWNGRIDCASGLAVIADGMGGHAAGGLASKSVVRSIMELASTAQSEADVARILETANQRIYREMFGGGLGRPSMGSTVVGAIFRDRRALAFNVGDSRLYVTEGDGLRRVSTDDTPEQALASPPARRSHRLTQSLGGSYAKVPLHPHIAVLELHDNAQMLLCSDGLTDMLSEAEIASLLRQGADPARALVSAALHAGGTDNVSVVVIGEAR
jgi:protein phosphatase